MFWYPSFPRTPPTPPARAPITPLLPSHPLFLSSPVYSPPTPLQEHKTPDRHPTAYHLATTASYLCLQGLGFHFQDSTSSASYSRHCPGTKYKGQTERNPLPHTCSLTGQLNQVDTNADCSQLALIKQGCPPGKKTTRFKKREPSTLLLSCLSMGENTLLPTLSPLRTDCYPPLL